MPNKLGRLPRTFDPAMPHFSALVQLAGPLPPPPQKVDWTTKSNPSYGMMFNDRIGDCTCAGAYHAMQVWSSQGRKTELTEPDKMVLRMYEEFCGYKPTNPNDPQSNSTDQGGVEQDIIHRWLTVGVPIAEGSRGSNPGRSKLLFAGEVDRRLHDDVKHAINDCGCVYIGFEVPQWLMEGEVPTLWDSGKDTTIVGGHCIVLPGYDDEGLFLISWGRKYKMSWRFFDTYVDEVYALAHPWWVDATGKTPLGLSKHDLEQQMAAYTHRAAAAGTEGADRR